jgi:2-polyprenyl-3-methyl-5-hydroxy-6-metoxy-1,4-benzoquinol methylase
MTMTDITPEIGSVCPCGSGKPLRPVFQTLTRRYVRCPSCDLVFLHPRPMRDRVEEYFRDRYDGDYGEAEASDDRLPVFTSVLNHLSAYRQPPGTLLDVGCGDGDFLMLCRQAGWTGVGMDLSQRAAARAAKRGCTMLAPQALERREGLGRFDVVTLINVLETVAEPSLMLRQVADALTADGLVLVRATNGAFHLPMRTPARWVGSQYDQAFHWYLYTTKALRSLMEAAGLHVVGVRNSRPSHGPLSPAHPWLSQLKWTLSRGLVWPLSQTLYRISGGHLVSAPSFEMVATRRGGTG